MYYLLTDDLWAAPALAVQQAKRHRGGQKPRLADRRFVEALLYLARIGIPWRDLPAEFGAWDAASNRCRRWVASGRLRRLLELLTADPRLGAVRCVLIDRTIVRAHVHAGARRQKGGRRPVGWAAAGAASPAR